MPSDCGNLDKNLNKSGIYTIYPRGLTGFKVFCEMDKAGGGWTVSIVMLMIILDYIYE